MIGWIKVCREEPLKTGSPWCRFPNGTDVTLPLSTVQSNKETCKIENFEREGNPI